MREGITARELRDALTKLSDEDLDKEVLLEGCDCYGSCRGVSTNGVSEGEQGVYGEGPFVVIERNGGFR